MAHEPDRTKPPTSKDLEGLPATALAAFTARCARRVQPLFLAAWPEAPREHIDAIDRAITLGALSGADPTSVSSSDLAAANAAANAAARDAAYTARAAAYAAAYAARDAARDAAYYAAYYAANAAAEAAAEAAAYYAAIIRVMWDDLDIVRLLLDNDEFHREYWPTEAGPGVPPEIFGNLWHHGPPEGWPEDTRADAAALSLYFDAEEFTKEETAAIIASLSAVYGSLSDDELIIENIDMLEYVLEPEEV